MLASCSAVDVSPEAVAEHARVPAVAVRVALGNLLKERVHKLLVVNVAERLTAGVQRAILGERNHVVSLRRAGMCAQARDG